MVYDRKQLERDLHTICMWRGERTQRGFHMGMFYRDEKLQIFCCRNLPLFLQFEYGEIEDLDKVSIEYSSGPGQYILQKVLEIEELTSLYQDDKMNKTEEYK